MMRNEAHTVDWTEVQRENKQIHFSNSQFFRRRAPSPVFFIEAPGRPVFPWSLCPSGYEGMARQGALP
jgi:hypothetical protein